MRLTVLGGSAAGPNTGAGCSGYLVESDGTRIVLDLGPGTLPELRRHADFRTVAGIVISHMHLDHVLDIAALRFALAYNPIKPPGRMPLWLPPGGFAQLGRIALAFADEGEDIDYFSSVFDVSEYDPGDTLTIGDIGLTFAPTIHYVPCWAMRLRSVGSGDLGYTADTGPSAPLSPFFAGVAVLIAEATLNEPGEETDHLRGHLTAREAGRLATQVNAETLVLSHIWEELHFEGLRADAAAIFRRNLVVAHPGTVVHW